MKYGVGQSVPRVEDERFLKGEGVFSNDLTRPGEAYACFVRSPHAHADIKSVATDDALALPGVLAVFTYQDLAPDSGSNLTCIAPIENRDGTMMAVPPHPVLATERVRHVGDPVAVVIGETPDAAADGADTVWVDYEALPSVTDTGTALADGSPVVWPQAPGNLAFDWDVGDAPKTEEAFANAHHVTRIQLVNNRLAPSAIEPRAAIGEYDSGAQKFTLYAGCQGRHVLRDALATAALGVQPEDLRVMTHDVGGGFGAKIFPYGEHAVVLLAARLLGRPVNWTATRNEVFLADAQARDHVTEAELALDQDGKFLAMRVSTMAGMGAYIQLFAPFIPTDAAGLHGVPYVIPAIHARVRGVYTNTVPVDAYRGAGKPEAAYVTERLVDAAAREMSIPPEVLRRRNFIQPDQMPYQTATGVEIDSGDFASLFEQGLELADRDGFAARRTASIERGMARGLGIGVYLEKTFGALGEYARMEVDPAGQVRVHLGTQSQGQGHETTFAQVVSERLGIPFEAVQLLYQDSETLPGGGGTMGSRSMVSGGTVVHRAADDLVSKGKELAATALDDQPDHIDFTDGHFHLRDTNRSVSLFDLAADPDHGFEGEGSCAEFPATFPNGVHICEVEIDPATGKISIERFSAVNDCGVVVNPMIVEGQVQGGVVQGLGQALLEHCVYDPVSGQLLTGSFMDYGLPRADMIPDIAVDQREIPTVNNDMGFKGVGEAGATGAPPALVNAVLNGLADLGVTDLDMPLWPEKIWQAIQAAKAA